LTIRKRPTLLLDFDLDPGFGFVHRFLAAHIPLATLRAHYLDIFLNWAMTFSNIQHPTRIASSFLRLSFFQINGGIDLSHNILLSRFEES
jgi:hypothetical protein